MKLTSFMPRDRQTFGVILITATFGMWGVFPIYFKWLDNVSPLEILAHRIIWSVVLLFLIIIFLGRLNALRRLLKIKKVILNLALSGALISANWGIFIYAVEAGHILETSLGYFISPLFSIFFGFLFLKEKLSKINQISLLIVFMAICVQIYALGRLPFICLLLPLSFAFYGLIRKKCPVPTYEGLFIETMLMTPFALIILAFIQISGGANFQINLTGFLLFFSGVITILPLLTFGAASKYLALSTIGFFQYISPSISFLIAIFLYNESFEAYKMLSFGLIWLSLGLSTIFSLKGYKWTLHR